jgi:hypothetical protein
LDIQSNVVEKGNPSMGFGEQHLAIRKFLSLRIFTELSICATITTRFFNFQKFMPQKAKISAEKAEREAEKAEKETMNAAGKNTGGRKRKACPARDVLEPSAKSLRLSETFGACGFIYRLVERGATNCTSGADDLRLQLGRLDPGFDSIISAWSGVAGVVAVVRNA